jgi:hypothetical protein
VLLKRSTVVTPTLFVPRDPAVRDGAWNEVDQQQVAAAQQQQQQQPQPHGQPCTDLQGFVLLAASPHGLEELALRLAQPRFRGQQMLASLLRGARSIGELRGLPRAMLDQLRELGVVTGRSAVHHHVVAGDGVQKLLLQLAEGHVVETVGIPAKDDGGRQRLTVCVSSQVRGGGGRSRGGMRAARCRAASHVESNTQHLAFCHAIGWLPDALLLLRHRQGRLCAQPGTARDCGSGERARNLGAR